LGEDTKVNFLLFNLSLQGCQGLWETLLQKMNAGPLKCGQKWQKNNNLTIFTLDESKYLMHWVERKIERKNGRNGSTKDMYKMDPKKCWKCIWSWKKIFATYFTLSIKVENKVTEKKEEEK